jgi:hypothetical protein
MHNDHVPGRRIGTAQLNSWPSTNPDLTKFDSFQWAYVKGNE